MHSLEPVRATTKREYEPAHSGYEQARSQITNELNRFVRRLRSYSTEGEWSSAVLDAASQFAEQVAIFALEDGVLRLRGQQNLNLSENLSFRPGSAAAFQNAITSRDPVIALRTRAEVGDLVGVTELNERAYIVPITNGPRMAAVLFAAGQEFLDISAIELVAGLGSMVLERQANASIHTQIANLPTSAKSKLAEKATALPAWADLSPDQRMLHVRARRFARTKVAEIELSSPEACNAGRKQENLYVFLKQEIDRAREKYRTQFMKIPSMIDYLHLELVQTAAEGDERKLGADYPGQLV